MHTIYLPLVPNDASLQRSMPTEQSEFLRLLTTHPWQERNEFNISIDLSKIAQLHACDMAERDYFGHVSPEGIGPNKRMRDAGIVLPDHYNKGDDGNNGESIGAGFLTVNAVVNGLIDSPSHKYHMLGLVDFYRNQQEVGAGYCYNKDSTYKHYWVFMSYEKID